MPQRNHIQTAEDVLYGIRSELLRERDKVERELKEIKWGIEVTEHRIGDLYSIRLLAEDLGKTIRAWFSLCRKEGE